MDAASLQSPQTSPAFGRQVEPQELVKDAEMGTFHAKRMGGDRIEAFRPALRQHDSDLATLEADLRRALGREKIMVLYQPVVRLEDKTIAGFEAMNDALKERAEARVRCAS